MATSAATLAPGTLPEAKPVDGFLAISLVAVLAVCVRAIWFTPVDAMLGAAQKIFYVHVPSAIAGLYVACGLLAISSILYLWLKDDRLDRLAEASAEVGLLFMGIVLVTGPIWARTSWGTWWVWDARLTSTLILLFLYLGYMALVSAIEDTQRADRAGALLLLVGVVNVPIIYFSVRWWNTLHQGASVSLTTSPKMARTMLTGMLLMSLAAWMYSIAAALHRVRTIILDRERHTRWVRQLSGLRP